MKRFIALLLVFFSLSIYSQQIQLSNRAEISLITAGPGNTELYEAFGHTTIRVYDPLQGIDDAYNYGIFDFDAPNFYLNFVKGNMLYKLAKYPFPRFVYSYKRNKRWINEQILNLTQEEKQHFFDYIENNAKPENATYSYDPYFNNCSTVVRDITKIVLGDKLNFNGQSQKTTLRTIMDNELPQNTWGSFGIDVALGSILDRKASFEETMYLPDHLSDAFKNATITRNQKKVPLVKLERKILDYKELEQKISFFNPLLIFSFILLLIAFITYKDFKNSKRNKWLDFTLYFVTGIIGLLIVFLWLFTNHSTAVRNFNFLWAFTPNLFVSFYMLKNKLPKWIKKYNLLLLILLLVVIIIWLLKVQVFSIAVLPILLFLGIRYFYLWKKVY
ncbi:MAG: DUF4105 domain-containing protein [Flavobacteriaceae bacterium]|nr:DUF4105 domain-containing protein [Flavobacteriaceae bacterium]